ncbi:biotin transporter BioY [Defluviimonas sp. WL0024]|uniref:Biotin transporter n=2 Tax=Albidovulum TaxID=205889 RepID=A0ABT3J8X3_9RHOB|nr:MULTISPECIES: biotin transporter BioY [Defluviimonas]MCU9850511.1 biotin transporter BioY [Defluviimonas sp. WL0024]MCW3784133.1 biotin transporter BioY [Defluviimonas salinarum]
MRIYQRERGRASTKISLGDISVAVLVAATIAVAAQIEVPFYPVPMTLQTLAVLSASLIVGFRRALGAMGIYLAAGALGMPVFAGGTGGIAILFGPTGGYLAGFVLAAAFCGLARDLGLTRANSGCIAVALIGAALVYPTGLLRLGAVVGWDKPVLEWGLYPFVAGDLVKAVIAVLFSRGATRLGHLWGAP